MAFLYFRLLKRLTFVFWRSSPIWASIASLLLSIWPLAPLFLFLSLPGFSFDVTFHFPASSNSVTTFQMHQATKLSRADSFLEATFSPSANSERLRWQKVWSDWFKFGLLCSLQHGCVSVTFLRSLYLFYGISPPVQTLRFNSLQHLPKLVLHKCTGEKVSDVLYNVQSHHRLVTKLLG